LEETIALDSSLLFVALALNFTLSLKNIVENGQKRWKSSRWQRQPVQRSLAVKAVAFFLYAIVIKMIPLGQRRNKTLRTF